MMKSSVIFTSLITLTFALACDEQDDLVGINKTPERYVFSVISDNNDSVVNGYAVDINNDGTPDYYSLDADDDGRPDFFDVNNDGQLDGIAFDLNGDGIADAAAIDSDNDGFYDSFDTTGDGAANSVANDPAVISTTQDAMTAAQSPDGVNDSPAGNDQSATDEPNPALDCLGGTMIDDFEDANTADLIRPFNDGSSSVMSPAPGSLFAAEVDPNTGSKALHLTGSGFSIWGAGLGRKFDVPQACKPRSTGIRFKIRGSGTLTFAGQVSAVIPTDEGGSCVSGDGCNNGHQTEVSVTNTVQTVEVLWPQLRQITDSGWKSLLTSFDPRSVLEILFSSRPSPQPFDFWIDDIELMDDDSDPNVVVEEPDVDDEGPVGPGVCQLDRISGKEFFDAKFSARRDPFYTYENLCLALADFPTFANTGDTVRDKQELAAFFANVKQETGELDYIEQFPESRGNTGNYYGRGPIQLTWDYNYRAAGEFLGIDLLSNPGLLATDGVVTWKSALWFWMRSDGAGKGTCHDGIHLGRGFGQTINIINGGLECPSSFNSKAQNRVNAYKEYCSYFSVTPGENVDC